MLPLISKAVTFFFGNVQLNLSANAVVRVDAFKMAQAVQLMLSPLHPSGLGSQPNHPIVIKWFYIGHETAGSSSPFMHTSLGEESKRVYHKANVLHWAKALFKMTYDYVDHAIQDADEPPPFKISCLCFVDAGLLFAYAEHPNTSSELFSGKWKAGTLSSVYLTEKVIPHAGSNTDNFVKFIHNANAALHELLDLAANKIAEFLLFIQHVQYAKTGGQVYISDYQGMSPQY